MTQIDQVPRYPVQAVYRNPVTEKVLDVGVATNTAVRASNLIANA